MRRHAPAGAALLITVAAILTVDPGPAAAGNLSKITIHPIAEGTVGQVTVLFNPKEYTITKATPWKHHDIQGLDAPTLEFTSGEPYRCVLEVTFDRRREGTSVREVTDAIERLAHPDPSSPDSPRLLVTWGRRDWTNHLLEAETTVVETAPDGTPLVARMRTVWSTFRLPEPPPPVDPPRVPVVLETLEGPLVSVPATLHGETIDLLTLQPNGAVKAAEVRLHDVQGLSPRVDFALGDPHRLRTVLSEDTSASGTDVRRLTDALLAMAKVDPELHRPPRLTMRWGDSFRFRCVLESLSVRFTMFLDDGTPVRAVLNATWKEFSPAEEQLKGNPRH